MNEPIDGYRAKLAEMRAILDRHDERRPGGLASAIEERSDATLTDALSWHVQRILYEILTSGCVYGPLRARWDAASNAIVACSNWRAGKREPDKAALRQYGKAPVAWPALAAACSPLVALVLGAYLDAGPAFSPSWGRSIGAALRTPYLAGRAVDADPKRRRLWAWGELPATMPAALSVALYRGHVVLALDCDALELYDPRDDGPRLRGVHVLAADGSFSDGAGGVRRYNCLPLRFEPAAVRGEREHDRPNARRRFALVGIRPPCPAPHEPRLVIA